MGSFGAAFGHFGAVWGHLGQLLAVLGQFEAILGLFEAILGQFGVIWGSFWPFWGGLRPFWGGVGTHLPVGHLGVLEDGDDVAHQGDAQLVHQLLGQVQQHVLVDAAGWGSGPKTQQKRAESGAKMAQNWAKKAGNGAKWG